MTIKATEYRPVGLFRLGYGFRLPWSIITVTCLFGSTRGLSVVYWHINWITWYKNRPIESWKLHNLLDQFFIRHEYFTKQPMCLYTIVILVILLVNKIICVNKYLPYLTCKNMMFSWSMYEFSKTASAFDKLFIQQQTI